jgi:hypothetical protein
VGIALSSWLKATQTASYLHKPYFAAKKMTSHQTAVFMEEKKWDYQGLTFAHHISSTYSYLSSIWIRRLSP